MDEWIVLVCEEWVEVLELFQEQPTRLVVEEREQCAPGALAVALAPVWAQRCGQLLPDANHPDVARAWCVQYVAEAEAEAEAVVLVRE